MPKADFEIVPSRFRNSLTIRDLNLGNKSVTNDAENVVKELLQTGKLTPGMRLFYYDSENQFDEITFNADGFTGFNVGPRE